MIWSVVSSLIYSLGSSLIWPHALCSSSLALVISARCRTSHYLSWINILEAECGWTKMIQDIYSNVSGGNSLLEDECISREDLSSCRDPLGWERQQQHQCLLRMPVLLNLNPRPVRNFDAPRLSSETWHSCSRLIFRLRRFFVDTIFQISPKELSSLIWILKKDIEETRWKLRQQTPMRHTG